MDKERDAYTKLTAVATYGMLQLQIKKRFPQLNEQHRNELVLRTIDSMARLRGYYVRRDCFHEDGESDG